MNVVRYFAIMGAMVSTHVLIPYRTIDDVCASSSKVSVSQTSTHMQPVQKPRIRFYKNTDRTVIETLAGDNADVFLWPAERVNDPAANRKRSIARLHESIDLNNTLVSTTPDGQCVTGFVSYLPSSGFIGPIAVFPHYRRQGHAERLLLEALTNIQMYGTHTAQFTTDKDNTKFQNFIEKIKIKDAFKNITINKDPHPRDGEYHYYCTLSAPSWISSFVWSVKMYPTGFALAVMSGMACGGGLFYLKHLQNKAL